jgi:hypothetical protein
MTAPYIRLDTLQQVEPKALLWGPSLKSSVFVKTGWLSRTQKPGQVPYMQKSAGGPDHIANMALSCQPCNRAAGALSVFEKVNLAIRSRLGEMAMAAGGGR